MKKRPEPNSTILVFCDTLTGIDRSFVPTSFRNHRINIIRKRLIWPSMNKDCLTWAKTVLSVKNQKLVVIQKHL